jgi:citrate lyase gamma subunit
MSKYSSKDMQGYEINANILAGLEAQFGEQIRFTLENVIASLETTGDDSLISSGYKYFRDVALSGSRKDVEQLSNFIDHIDWSDPINGAYELN